MRILVSGIEQMQLCLPAKSVDGYQINRDCGYVDHRCLRRYRRKASKAWRARQRSPAAVAQRLEEAKLLRQWEIEDAAKKFIKLYLHGAQK